jgi:hypothetical protein
VVLNVETQGALVPVREIDLYFPSADHVWRLGLSQSGATHLNDDHQNKYANCPHVFPLMPVWSPRKNEL